jgi:DNA-directed RNA polymerase subunit RPC12/RpoP
MGEIRCFHSHFRILIKNEITVYSDLNRKRNIKQVQHFS